MLRLAETATHLPEIGEPACSQGQLERGNETDVKRRSMRKENKTITLSEGLRMIHGHG